MIRGAVYRIDLGRPRGHEQGGRRYGLVVSPSDSNLPVATVVPTSRSARPLVFRPMSDVAGLPTVFLIDQVRSIDTRYIVGDPVDHLSRNELEVVEFALAHYLGIHRAHPLRP